MAGRTPTSLRRCISQHNSISCSRTFSSSCRRDRHGLLATYPPSSSTELDNILAHIRKTIFVPNHLKPMHRELVYRKKLEHYITGEEPTEVSIQTVDAIDPTKTGEEKFILQPLNHFQETSGQKMIADILPLLQTKEDWAMFSSFLREFKASDRVLKQGQISKIIRAAHSTGHYGIVIEMFKRVRDLGLVINNKEVALEIMLLCLGRASKSQWSEPEVIKASKHAEAALWMMVQPQHAPNGVVHSQANHREVIGVALMLAATKSKLHNYEDESDKVATHAQSFMKAHRAAGSSFDIFDKDSLVSTNEFLTSWSPAWAGLQLTQRIIKDVDLLRQVEDTTDQLRNQLLSATDAMKKFPKWENRRGIVTYNTVAEILEV